MAPPSKTSASSSRRSALPVSFPIHGFDKTNRGFGTQRASSLSYLQEPLAITKAKDQDPALVVIFKNLTKKDATTKTKALEELRGYLQGHTRNEIDEEIIDAWATLFPRLAIENERKVRELSHAVQFLLFSSQPSRRAVATHSAKLLPSWIAGMGDRDKQIVDMVKSNIDSLLTTPEKRKGFFIKHQSSILNYALNVLLETPETLSDERSVTKEDMLAKYTRAISSSIYLVYTLFKIPDVINGVENSTWMVVCEEEYDEFLTNSKVWCFIGSEDVMVRARLTFLLDSILHKKKELVLANLEMLSNSIIGEGLRTEQPGSATNLLDVICALTVSNPTAWTKAYKGKKPALLNLQKFITKGSQNSENYWEALRDLISCMPQEVMPLGLKASVEFMKCMRTGMTHRSEMLQNSAESSLTFLEAAKLLYDRLGASPEKAQFLEEVIYPIFSEYLNSHPSLGRLRTINDDLEKAERFQEKFWDVHTVRNEHQMTAVIAAFKLCASLEDPDAKAHFFAQWKRLEVDFIQKIEAPIPVKSIDYNKSQGETLLFAHQWFRLFGEVLDLNSEHDWQLRNSVPVILEAVGGMMTTQSGNAYSSAATLEAALRYAGELLIDSDDSLCILRRVFVVEARDAGLIFSPSSHFFVSALHLAVDELHKQGNDPQTWAFPAIMAFASTLMPEGVEPDRPPHHAFTAPFSSDRLKLAEQLFDNEQIQELSRSCRHLQYSLQSYVVGAFLRDERQSIFALLAKLQCVDQSTTKAIVKETVHLLQLGSDIFDSALNLLIIVSGSSPLSVAFDDGESPILLQLLIFYLLADIEVSEKDGRIDRILKSAISTDLYKSEVLRNMVSSFVMNTAVEAPRTPGQKPSGQDPKRRSPPIEPIALLVNRILRDCNRDDFQTVSGYFPLKRGHWVDEFKKLADAPLNPALALLDPFPTARNLKQEYPPLAKGQLPRRRSEYFDGIDAPRTDGAKYTSLLRTAMYVLLTFKMKYSESTPAHQRECLLFLGMLTEVLVESIQFRDCRGLYVVPQTVVGGRPVSDEHELQRMIEVFQDFVKSYTVILSEYARNAVNCFDVDVEDVKTKVNWTGIPATSVEFVSRVYRASIMEYMELPVPSGTNEKFYISKALERLLSALTTKQIAMAKAEQQALAKAEEESRSTASVQASPQKKKQLEQNLEQLRQAVGERIYSTGLENFLSSLHPPFSTNTTEPEITAAILLGLNKTLLSSKIVHSLINNLVSDLGTEQVQASITTKKLILFDSCLKVYQGSKLPVAAPRLLKAVNRVLSWGSNLDPEGKNIEYCDKVLAVEVMRTVRHLLPRIEDVSGSHWEYAIQLCGIIWRSCAGVVWTNDKLPALGISLALYHDLKVLAPENDDIHDELEKQGGNFPDDLAGLLASTRTNNNHEILKLIDKKLLDLAIKTKYPEELPFRNDLYRSLRSNSKAVQSGTFVMIKKRLFHMRQELSVVYDLEMGIAERDSETIQFDTLDQRLLAGAAQDTLEFPPYHCNAVDGMECPAAVRGYLMNWLVIYESIAASSFRVREVCIDTLIKVASFDNLFELLVEILGHTEDKACDLRRAGIEDGMIRNFDILRILSPHSLIDENVEMMWMCANIFWLAIKYSPSIIMNWTKNLKSKRTRLVLEDWSVKYYTPLIIQDQLNELQDWIKREQANNDELMISVKPLKHGDVYVRKDVGDGYFMCFTIHIPKTYPFERMSLIDTQRVVLTEKVWNAVMMAVLGNIMLNNGTIVEGIELFRRNITAQMKGMEECSICYSYVSSDKKMADRKCAQCKHPFHGKCLFQWFSTSNQNTCPLCRNAWSLAR